MSLFSTLFSCFSDRSNGRVISFDGKDHGCVEGKGESRKNDSKSKSKPPPIPTTYFPAGSQFPRL
ncbi:hypothetical protein ACJRO7_021943 [Eucalyptus globulus]|uniref:Uncharacterized protein n=1 Tax=Eucalyptus globulus TaxID=34317 RepID=A0ABD3KLK0_EUCGL